MNSPEFLDLSSQDDIQAYFRQLTKVHGIIRLVDLIGEEDTANVQIDRLFIEPQLAEEHVAPERSVSEWPDSIGLVTALKLFSHLVLLGDPGSGKSTLVSWLTTRFARSSPNLFITELGDLVPFPIVLRELDIAAAGNWMTLLQQFCAVPYLAGNDGKPLLKVARIQELMRRGQALLLLDGVDEIGSVELRQKVRSLIYEAQSSFPKARWVLTSRVVGFDEVPILSFKDYDELYLHRSLHVSFDKPVQGQDTGLFSEYPYVNQKDLLPFNATIKPSSLSDHVLSWLRVLPEEATKEGRWRTVLDSSWQIEQPVPETRALILYVMPFLDRQIEQYASSWYSVREPVESIAKQRADNFISSLRGHPHLTELSRSPILLAFLAFIHRRDVRLPNGRAEVYSRIADIFLERIPLRKHFDTLYRLDEKRRWLGKIGLRLQARRSEDDNRALTLSRDELHMMLAEVMAEDGPLGANSEISTKADEFLRFVARTAGLLLPKGEDDYAFVHLSFQEFFAASAIRDIASRRTFAPAATFPSVDRRQCILDAAGVRTITPSELAEILPFWSGAAVWSETLLLSTELLDEEDGEIFVLSCMVGSSYDDAVRGLKEFQQMTNCLRLVARIALDPTARLSAVCRSEVLSNVMNEEIEHRIDSIPAVVRGDNDFAKFLDILSPAGDAKKVYASDLSISDVSGLARFRKLEELWIDENEISDLAPISRLASLERVSARQNNITSLSSLSKLKSLNDLQLGENGIEDISPLEDLTRLIRLNLSHNKVLNFEVLDKLINLEILVLDGVKRLQLKTLANLRVLRTLYLREASLDDLSYLENLGHLQTLQLSSNSVADLAPLAGLSRLTTLALDDNEVLRIEALQRLVYLERLYLSDNMIDDLSPLGNLSRLSELRIADNLIENLAPLSTLISVSYLDISGNRVSNLEPLRAMQNLHYLDFSYNEVSNISCLAHLTSLAEIDLSGNPIEDYSPLAKLPRLNYVTASSHHLRALERLNKERASTGLQALFVRQPRAKMRLSEAAN